MPGLRVVFMGTPDFALQALKALHENSDHEVTAVYSQPPRPKGRGHKLQKCPVQDYADAQNIPTYHPATLKSHEAQEEFAALNADIAVVAAYGLILPKAILQAPKQGCVNIHASLLPRWRGAAPIQRAIWEGDRETGVTLMQMDEGLDTGNMLAKRAVPITETTTAAALHDELAAMGAEMIIELLDSIAAGEEPQGIAQDDAFANYAAMLSKEDGHIDWTQSAEAIERQIRALNPWPGVWTESEGERLKILEAEIMSDEETTMMPGEVRNKQGHIACGGGTVLKLLRVQPAGKKAMDFTSALNGGYIDVDDVFS